MTVMNLNAENYQEIDCLANRENYLKCVQNYLKKLSTNKAVGVITNMNKLFIPLMVIVCIFTACDKDEVLSGEPMEWTYEIQTPENVKCEDGSVGWPSKFCFKANAKEGTVVMTCENFDVLNPISGDSYTYDCEWATLKVEANRLIIHFLPYASEAQDVYEEVKISANDGKRNAHTIICLSRTFEGEGQPGFKPETLPEEAKFKMVMDDFTPLMHLDSPLPAPLDLITFRITDINGHYAPMGFPEFTQYYDSIVWSADNYPHTFKVYESSATAAGMGKHLTTQWGSHFFSSGTVKNHLKGYRHGKVEYETSINITLYERDFLGLDWSVIVLQKPQNLTAYCRLDRNYEYKVFDIVAKNNASYSQIIPINHKQLSDADFLTATQKAISALMENNVGEGQNAKGKENLFKCLPEKGVEAELYWENKTSRMLMLRQFSGGTDELGTELYYLHVEPK